MTVSYSQLSINSKTSSFFVSVSGIILSHIQLEIRDIPHILSLVDNIYPVLDISSTSLKSSTITDLTLTSHCSFISSGFSNRQMISDCTFRNISIISHPSQRLKQPGFTQLCTFSGVDTSYAENPFYGALVSGITPLTLSELKCVNSSFTSCTHTRSLHYLRTLSVPSRYNSQCWTSFSNHTDEVSSFEECTASIGAAFSGSTLNVSFTSCSFNECVAHGYNGGAIDSYGSSNHRQDCLNITNCNFTGCHSNFGGGAVSGEEINLVRIDSSNFTWNTAENYLPLPNEQRDGTDIGGAVRLVRVATISISKCFFTCNTARNDSGHDIYIYPASTSYSITESYSLVQKEHLVYSGGKSGEEGKFEDWLPISSSADEDDSCPDDSTPSYSTFFGVNAEYNNAGCYANKQCGSLSAAVETITEGGTATIYLNYGNGRTHKSSSPIGCWTKNLLIATNSTSVTPATFEPQANGSTYIPYQVFRLSTGSLYLNSFAINMNFSSPTNFWVSSNGTLKLTHMTFSYTGTIASSFSIELSENSTFSCVFCLFKHVNLTSSPLIHFNTTATSMPKMTFTHSTFDSITRIDGNGSVLEIT